MNRKPAYNFLATILIAISGIQAAAQNSAHDIVVRADEKLNGEKSSYSVMTMTIVRPSWQRSIEFRSWSMGRAYALTLITQPAREKGQSFLKRGNEMWSWNPTVSRLIKLPPSMMSQGWMGSDYTNDDILRESSVADDYTHEIEKEEKYDGSDCWKITLKAKENAGVIWSRQVWWVEKKEFNVLKAELYDEDGYLVRTETATQLKTFDGRLLPSVLEIVPAETPGNKTIVTIKEMKFNTNIGEAFFSQQNMKDIR